jgi:diguanylate cyclase (GGDEF)-like protein/PAS domain S-box-containing protein
MRWVPRHEATGTTVDGIVAETTYAREHERQLVGLQSLAEMSSDLVALTDLEHRVVFLNDYGRRLLGLDDLGDLGDVVVTDLLTDEANARWESQELPAILEQGRWQGECTVRVPASGEVIPVQGSSYLIHDPHTGEPMAIAVVRRDLSETRRVQEEQRGITEIATAIAEGAEQGPLLEAVAQRALEATASRAVAIVRAAGHSREVVAGAGPPAAARALVADGPQHRAPIVVHGRDWGWLVAEPVAAPAATAPVDAAIAESLERFARLAATALLTCQTRERLMKQATSDFVTGLSNHRAFQQRLGQESSHADRSGESLALVVFDLDGFKRVNDEHGHPLGDEVLRDLGQVLRMETREHDMAARIGGDEFALLLVGAASRDAVVVARRCTESFAASAQARGLRVGLSAGIADRSDATAPEELLRLADGALYWAKRNRAGVVVYDQGVVRELSARERAESLERSQVLTALRVLARVTDLKDPSTHQHSARVAALARRLAAAAGWSAQRQAWLHEAALVHDVGKVVVSDAILRKPGRLTAEEYDEVKRHAGLGAEIAAGALSDEQVRWIREHHERPDGLGYPDGLREESISEGAQLLALADCWDVMTTGRSYQAKVTAASALAECRELIDRQFTARALHALQRCWEVADSPFEVPDS